MVQRFSNRVAKPASGPDCSVPAIGWPGMTATPGGAAAAIASPTAPLTEPTSDRMAPGSRPRAPAMAAGADRGRRHGEDDQVGAARRLGRVGDHLVGHAQLDHPRAHRRR